MASKTPSAATLTTVAESWITRYPKDGGRIGRALALCLDGLCWESEPGIYTVVGGSFYTVIKGEPCTCKDAFYRSERRCAHRWAASLMARAAEVEYRQTPQAA